MPAQMNKHKKLNSYTGLPKPAIFLAVSIQLTLKVQFGKKNLKPAAKTMRSVLPKL